MSTRLRSPAADVAGLGIGRAFGFVAPALLLIGAFLVFPAFWTIYIGVTNYRLTGVEAVSPSIVGLSNYTKALNDALFHNALWLTMLFVLGSAIIGQNILGFTYRNLKAYDLAFKHYKRAIELDPRHRGAHEYIGETYLLVGDVEGARRHLAALKTICLLPCDELTELERAIAKHLARK